MITRAKRCLIATSIYMSLIGLATFVDAQSMQSVDYYYSRGVHHYFSGCTACAEEALTLAISWDPDDPRPYYFRAMNRLRMGQEYAARDDMQLGAELEAQSPGKFAVGRSLERVQGVHRLLLEKYRQNARRAHAFQRRMLNAVQQEQMLERNNAVERRRVPVPLENLTGDVEAEAFASETEPRPPQTIGPPTDVAPPVEAPATGEAPEESGEEEFDPFRDDPLAAPADEPSAEEEPAVEDTAPTDVDVQPFGEEPPDGEENPFDSIDF